MPETPEPIQVGFAEFAAKLISEVFEAVFTSQLDQEKRISELVSAAGLLPEEFADRYVTEDQVDAELTRLFPGDSKEHPSFIYVGAPYRPAKKDVSELPPINAELGVILEKTDYTVKKQGAALNTTGVNKIRAAVRQNLANANLTAIQEIIRRGISRVVADAGRVNAKLTYEVIEVEKSAEPKKSASPSAGIKPSKNTLIVQEPGLLSKLRLEVRQADERAPQTQKLQVNVFGEVEIDFKTIT